jgi:ribosomal protein S18 acetylase RimI-like enzyme
MIVRHAGMEDIDLIIQLNRKYLGSSLTSTQRQRGFLGKLYTREELGQIVADKHSVISTDEGQIAGYYLIGRKDDPDASAYKRNTVLQSCESTQISLPTVAYPTQVCIDAAYRGTGLFGQMLTALMASIKGEYEIVLCSVSENNPASIAAHLKSGWQLINTFESRQFFKYCA